MKATGAETVILFFCRFSRAFPDVISKDVLYHEVCFIFQKKSILLYVSILFEVHSTVVSNIKQLVCFVS